MKAFWAGFGSAVVISIVAAIILGVIDYSSADVYQSASVRL